MKDEVKSMVQCLTDIEKDVAEGIKAELAKGFAAIQDPKEMDYAFDWLKDVADAKKNCLEACYYHTVIEAMEEGGDEESEMYGYNNRRMANGQYASKGRGHISGYKKGRKMPYYKPYMDQEPYVFDWMKNPEEFSENMRMGYDPNWKSGMRHTDMNGQNYGPDSYPMTGDRWDEHAGPRHGKAYEDFKTARRHYQSSGNAEDRNEMSMHAQEHVNDTIATMRDIWKSADTEMKKQMKLNMEALVKEMTV